MRRLMLVVLLVAAARSVSAQQPVIQRVTTVAPPRLETYVYQAEGRRDPFTSLLNGGTDVKASLKHDGIQTFMLGEVSVRGILQSRSTLVAMVQGPDNKTYLIHQGDKLADAVVKSVTTQGLVVMQDVSDPLSTKKQREVRKLLRSLEGTEK